MKAVKVITAISTKSFRFSSRCIFSYLIFIHSSCRRNEIKQKPPEIYSLSPVNFTVKELEEMESGADGDRTACSAWLNFLKESSKTCMVSKAGMKRIYYKFPDGREMLEDWKVSNTKARELLGRYWLRKSVMGKQLHWDIEFGEDSHLQALKSSHRQSHATPEELLIAQNNSNPTIASRSTAGCYEWRIRNLPWPKENYKVCCDESQSFCLVVSTRNKKYYKKLHIQELERLKIPLQTENVLTQFANRTLVVQYKKPLEVIELEWKVWEEVISPIHQERDEDGGSPSGCTNA